jgi:dolichyl-phosphate-mannose--protein O-mannosyl transferase
LIARQSTYERAVCMGLGVMVHLDQCYSCSGLICMMNIVMLIVVVIIITKGHLISIRLRHMPMRRNISSDNYSLTVLI